MSVFRPARPELVCAFGAAAFAIFSVAPVYSQSLLEEVVVTAQKREESVQDVGIAITAFTGEQLDSFGFNDSTEITSMTPGVHISGNNGGNTLQFTIRGSTQSDFADLLESPNAVYVDEAYIATGQGHKFAQYDMQRVEILKGPQGTLFGRNATGGLVQYVTNKPTDEFEAYGDFTYGSYNQVRFEGAVSGPITENFKARLSGMVNRWDNYLDNVFPNQLPAVPNGLAPAGRTLSGSPSGADDLGNADDIAFRAQGLFDFSETTELLISGQYFRQNPGSGPYQSVGSVAVRDAQGRFINSIRTEKYPTTCEEIGPGGCVENFLDLDVDGSRPRPTGDLFGYVDPDGDDLNTSTDHAVDDYDETEIFSITGTFKHEFSDALSMTWLHNFSHQEKETSLDVDSGPAPQFIVMNDSEHDWYSQELRFNGTMDRMRWVAGAYFLYIDAEYNAGLADTIGGINVFGASPPPNGFGNPNLFLEGSLNSELETKSYSLFGQVDYDLTDMWTAIFGLRWIREDKEFDFGSFFYVNTDDRTVDSTGPLAPLLPAHSESTSDDLWTGKAQLNFTPNDDWLLYFGVSRGVKAGSFNAPLLTFLAPHQYGYGEEKLLSFEGGFKATILDGKARVNGSFYHYDYSDYQAFQFIGTSGAVFNVDGKYTGMEIDIATTPVKNLDFVFGLSLIDAELKDLEVAPGVQRDVNPTFTPSVQMSGLVRYTFPAAIYGGDVALQADSNYASSSFYNVNNFDSHKMPAYVLGNARVSWYSPDGHWDAQFFVKNLADERNQTIGYELATICGCDEQSFGLPRWFGFSLRYTY